MVEVATGWPVEKTENVWLCGGSGGEDNEEGVCNHLLARRTVRAPHIPVPRTLFMIEAYRDHCRGLNTRRRRSRSELQSLPCGEEALFVCEGVHIFSYKSCNHILVASNMKSASDARSFEYSSCEKRELAVGYANWERQSNACCALPGHPKTRLNPHAFLLRGHYRMYCGRIKSKIAPPDIVFTEPQLGGF